MDEERVCVNVCVCDRQIVFYVNISTYNKAVTQ